METAMNPGLLLFLLQAERRADERRSAEEWRRLHTRPDALPLPPPAVVPNSRPSFAAVRRLLLRQA
jgi:hypothetical protein